MAMPLACMHGQVATGVQDGRFEDVATARATQGGAPPAQPVTVARSSAADPKRQVKFEIVDQAPSMKSERWERVVAVVCSGKIWQFKEWPFSVRRHWLMLRGLCTWGHSCKCGHAGMRWASRTGVFEQVACSE